MRYNRTEDLAGTCLSVVYQFQLDGFIRYNWLGIAVCFFVLSPIVVLLNGMILLTVYNKKHLWKNIYFFICGLAMSDFLAGLLSMPATGFIYTAVYRGWMSCYLYVSGFALGYISIGTSLFSVWLLSTDRYISVFHPYYYERNTHDPFLPMKITLFFWIIVILLVISSFFTKRFILYIILTVILAPISTVWMFYVQAKIAVLVKRLCNATSNQVSQTTTRTANRDHREYQHDRNVAWLASVIVVAMIVCYSPAVIILSIAYSGLASKTFFDQRFVGYGWALFFANINSVINPMLFGMQITEIRTGMKMMIFSLFKKRKNGVGIVT